MLNNASQAYDRFCTMRFEPASEDQILDLERKIGVGLPNDFREYLRLYNGGRFNMMPRFAMPDPKYPLDCLKILFGIGGPSAFTNMSSLHNLNYFDNNYPAIILPIGVTLMNNLTLLRTQDAEDKGHVLLKRAFEDLGTVQLPVLAESIDDFFGLLRENPDA